MSNDSTNRQKKQCLRRQLFVAPKAQGRIVSRAMLYCVVSTTLAATLFVLGTTFLTRFPVVAVYALVVIGTLGVCLPWAMYDSARASNRLIGPFIRAQGVIRRIANREKVPHVKVREGEDWSDWFHDFNVMIKRINPADVKPRHRKTQTTSGEKS